MKKQLRRAFVTCVGLAPRLPVASSLHSSTEILGIGLAQRGYRSLRPEFRFVSEQCDAVANHTLLAVSPYLPLAG